MGAMDAVLSKRDTGHSFDITPAMNVAGYVYTTFISAYTALLLLFIGLLWFNRRHPAVRLRGVILTSAALILLHVYVAALFIVYPLNGWYKCGTEFWYMSIIFPFGIALYQAANAKLMAVSRQQQHLAETSCCWLEKKRPFSFSPRLMQKWFRDLDYLTKTYVAVGCGMVFQLLLTLVLFFGSKRFNPSTGFFGEHVDAYHCRQGAEWIPSVVWQFLWTWLFGPVFLYKTRHIKDTHNWALQTRLTIIAGLPGTPMWLAFLYLNNPTLDNFNMWWPPAMWFAPGLITMQITTLAMTFRDIWRNKALTRPPSQQSSISSGSDRLSSDNNGRKSKDNWDAFEFQLKHNIQPLFWFAATKDFTGENILFLKEVRDFKRKWRRRLTTPPQGGLVLSAGEQRDMFEDAARIYFELVCPETSRCVINLDSKTTNSFKDIFGGLSYEPPVEVKSARKSGPISALSRHEVAPWESPALQANSRPETGLSQRGSEAALIDGTQDDRSIGSKAPSFSLPSPANLAPASTKTMDEFDAMQSLASPISLTVSNAPLLRSDPAMTISHEGIIQDNATGSLSHFIVPANFSFRIFDKAEDSIKYLVYTNTWKSFANAVDTGRYESMDLTASRRASAAGSTVFNSNGADGHVAAPEMSQVTDVELYPVDLEMQDKEDMTFEGLHHGVLDSERGPVPWSQVDSRCGCCRKKDEEAKRKAKTGANGQVVVKKLP